MKKEQEKDVQMVKKETKMVYVLKNSLAY
jgi:hypothetical protein